MRATDIREAVRVSTLPDHLQEKERKEAEQEQAREKVNDIAAQIERDKWLKHPYTLLFLRTLHEVLDSKQSLVVDISDKPQVPEGLLKIVLLESKTLKKVLHYARTGSYPTN